MKKETKDNKPTGKSKEKDNHWWNSEENADEWDDALDNEDEDQIGKEYHANKKTQKESKQSVKKIEVSREKINEVIGLVDKVQKLTGKKIIFEDEDFHYEFKKELHILHKLIRTIYFKIQKNGNTSSGVAVAYDDLQRAAHKLDLALKQQATVVG